jgi:hypothetical protein
MDKEKQLIFTGEYYSTMKNNEMISFAGKWIELEIIMLHKINQTQKDKSLMFSFMWNLGP